MKTIAFAFLTAVSLVFAPKVWADTTTDTAPAVITHDHEATIDLTKGKEIPPEVVEKLSAEQLYELMQTKLNKSADVPTMAPLIVGIVFACPVAIVAVILYYRHRRNSMLHRTLAAMIDKGVPIPPELLQPERPPKSDLRRGFVLIAVGIGLILYFAVQKEGTFAIGFIPLLMGAGYLVAWKLEHRKPTG